MSREDGRKPDQLRPISFEPDFLENPHGSVVDHAGPDEGALHGDVQEDMPRWMRSQGRGWITAEYSLLPASTGDRVEREAARGKQQGRTVEIQRLIGRAVRAVVDFQALGERTLWLDCDVLQADGGTRCAAICGAYVAAMRALERFGLSRAFRDSVAAVSVGVVDGVPLLDLDYSEDSSADTDMNVVMTGDGRLVEVQATAERDPFARETLDELLELAAAGIGEIARLQAEAVARDLPDARIAPPLGWPASSCACSSRPRSAARSGSSASCASGRPACARTSSSASARRCSRSSRAYGFEGVLSQRPRRRRPDAHRGADRERDRLPRRGRDHPPGPLGARPHDRGDALARGRDRDGGGRRLLERRADRDRRRARHARAAPRRVLPDARRFRPALDRLLVELPAGGSPAPIIEAIERNGGRVLALDVATEGERRSVAVDVELPPGIAPVGIVAGVAEIDGVLEVQWTD